MGQWAATPLQVSMCLFDTGVLDEHQNEKSSIFQRIWTLHAYYSIIKLLAGLWRLVQWAAMPVQISMQVPNMCALDEHQKTMSSIFQRIWTLPTQYSIKKLLAGLWRLVQWATMPVQISMQVLNTGELNEQQK